MATKQPQLGLMRLVLRASQFSRKGFTLIELLVAMVVGSLIIGTLLYLVVELLQVNRREEVLTQTQQDMQRAIDYISRDAREAVLVFSTPGAVIDQLDDLPTGATPILAFWRLDPINLENTNNFWKNSCSTAFSGTSAKQVAKRSECETLKLRQSFYTLVVYLQQNNKDGELWEGPSRILRYELPKYSSKPNITSLTQTQGYWDPTAKDNSFLDWSKASTAVDETVTPGSTSGNVAVLTDYVDSLGNDPSTASACPIGYFATPAQSNSFYACVSNEAAQAAAVLDPNAIPSGTNQSLLIFLRGNATEGRPGLVNTFSEAGRTPTLEAEILIRGILDKSGS
ncbi:MAG: prepilin-type N-terminal cleavage/methylation domain-containing protein [Nodosilinea sp.]